MREPCCPEAGHPDAASAPRRACRAFLAVVLSGNTAARPGRPVESQVLHPKRPAFSRGWRPGRPPPTWARASRPRADAPPDVDGMSSGSNSRVIRKVGLGRAEVQVGPPPELVAHGPCQAGQGDEEFRPV